MKRWGVRLLPVLAFLLFAGAARAGEGVSVEHFFLVLVAILFGAKVFGELAERIGQPAVLGELIAGVVLGASALGVIPPDGTLHEVIDLLAEIGVALLLFEIGLETDLKEMSRVGPSATLVACVGVVMPFLLGFLYWMLVQPQIGTHPAGISETMVAIFVGATLTATSVGITARVLTDLKRVHTPEARVIIGAAVVDDVLGLVILAIVSALAAGATVSLLSISLTFAKAVGFLVAAVIVGTSVAPRLFGLIDRMRVRGVLLVSAICFALLIAALAGLADSALIIGSFAAGLVLSSTNQFDMIVEKVEPVADMFIPIFFVSIGASVNIGLIIPGHPDFEFSVLAVGAALLLIAVVGKVISGYSVGWGRNKLSHIVIGVGMMPRGEVGLIFADIGLGRQILSSEVFSAILIMVIATTFIAPPLLKVIFRRVGPAPAPAMGADEAAPEVVASP
ncbi:MAG TPA: cation:proton antiporter [Longimicrobiales bacterium]